MIGLPLSRALANTAGLGGSGRTEQHASCDGRPCTHWLRVVRVRENLVATGKAVRESLQQRARGNIRVLVADRQAPTTPSFMVDCLLRRPLCLLRAGAEEAVELASLRQATGCIRATYSYIQLPTTYVPEMRDSSPYPYAVRKSPGRQSEKRLQLAFHAKCCWPVGRRGMGTGPLGDQLGKPLKRKYQESPSPLTL